jgi:hypothetical protein
LKIVLKLSFKISIVGASSINRCVWMIWKVNFIILLDIMIEEV